MCTLTVDKLKESFASLEQRFIADLVFVESRQYWERSWNAAFPHLAFSDQELQEATHKHDGFLGLRMGVLCYIATPL